MMNPIHVLQSDKTLKWIFLLFALVYILFDLKGLYNTPIEVANNDNYKDLFQYFLDNGYYAAVAGGTSILYNLFLKSIYFFTNSVDASFFLLNAISELTLIFFGCYFCFKVFGKTNKYFYIISIWYVLQILSMRSAFRASNDTFLGVFVMLLLYLLVFKIYDRKKELRTFALIGIVFACCLTIRITAILLIPIIGLAFIYWIKNTSIHSTVRAKLILVFAVMAIVITGCFHFPSLAEHHKLSFENKDPKSLDVNWVQRNYLGLKKIEDKKEKWHRDAIWKHTKFDEVVAYVQVNGDNSLPRTFPDAFKMNPLLVLKMAAWNVIVSISNYSRFWAFLFLVPVIGLFSKDLLAKHKLPAALFLCYIGAISCICFTFIELRWFYGYEVLLPVSILSYMKGTTEFASDRKKNLLFSVSLLLVTLFNLKSIFF